MIATWLLWYYGVLGVVAIAYIYRNFWDRKAVFFLADMGYCIALSVTVSFTAKCNLYH